MNLRDNSAVVIDIETSGVNPFRHDILSVGLVPIDPKIAPMVVYVRSDHIVWSDYARQIFDKYAVEWEAHAVSPHDACTKIEEYLTRAYPGRPATPIGHNIGFDLAFLRKLAFLGGREQLAGLSHRAVDTHTLLYVLVLKGKLPESVLSSDGAFRHFNIDVPEPIRHTAIGDAQATRELVLRLFSMFDFEQHGLISAKSAR
jgi:DNA polymerase III epsilon subunit-like protein